MLARHERLLAVNGEGGLGRAADDEPVFVLRAQDRFAPAMVRDWADRLEAVAQKEGSLTLRRAEKITEARALANAMDDWQAANRSKTPD